MFSWHTSRRSITQDRALIMAILNVTPDSFSDGGQFFDPATAIEHARQMVADGADLLDVGAESTRPYGGAEAVPLDEEMRRLEPILPAVLDLGAPVSIDTMKATVAENALQAGAAIVNDVWGLQRDPDMAGVVARHGAPVLVMHNRDRADPNIDIMRDIDAFFSRSLAIWKRAVVGGTTLSTRTPSENNEGPHPGTLATLGTITCMS